MRGNGSGSPVLRTWASARVHSHAELKRFRKDERGVTAVLFGIMFTMLFLTAAIVVDLTRATHEQSQEQAAVDAAALAASQYLGLENEDGVGQQVAQRFFRENMGNNSTAEIVVDLDAASGTVTAKSSNDFGMTLMRANKTAHQKQTLNVGATATVVKGSGTIEVAMVLDNSGSMAGTKLETLKTAANNLLGIVFAGASGTDDVKVGLVPFAASVNVGANYRGAAWIDNDGESSIHNENFSGSASRFALFDQLNTPWAGCVETRPNGLDVTDATPSSSNGDTLFVPMFAPDEPDSVNADAAGYSDQYNNNYISDFGGTCPTPAQVCLVYNRRRGRCTTWGPEPIDVATAQSRTCKYQNAPQTGGSGPNQSCIAQSLLDLTPAKSDAESAITAMVARGNTNVAEGTAWGWRLLSPTAPFTNGKDYDDAENRKVLIVMTDGDNYLQDMSNPNESVYAANGYASKGRLGATYTSSAYTSAINAKTLSACSNAKATGITVYTVAFGTDISSTGLNLLRQCATSQDHAFLASNNATLIQAFQNIGREIAKLRINS